MKNTKFGLLYPDDLETVVDPVEFGIDIERWGYDSLWLTDFILSPCYDPMISLAAVAQRTSRIDLGTAVMIVPYRSPLQLVKAAASLDALSGGRLILGVGLGANPVEFAAMGVDIRQRGRVTDEGLAVMRRLMTETDVTHAGRYHRFERASIGPHAGSRRAVPLWNGPIWRDGFVDGVLRRTALYCDGFLPTRVPVAGYRDAQARIRELALAAGREPDAIDWGVLLWFCLADDSHQALSVINAEVLRRTGHQTGMVARDGNAVGTPAQCVDAIRAYLDLGITHVVLNPGSPPEAVLEQCARFSTEVLPLLR